MILFSRAVQHVAKDTLFEIEKEVIAIDRKNEALDNAKPQSKKARLIGLTIYSKTL